jgi:hypothetical protein
MAWHSVAGTLVRSVLQIARRTMVEAEPLRGSHPPVLKTEAVPFDAPRVLAIMLEHRKGRGFRFTHLLIPLYARRRW